MWNTHFMLYLDQAYPPLRPRLKESRKSPHLGLLVQQQAVSIYSIEGVTQPQKVTLCVIHHIKA